MSEFESCCVAERDCSHPANFDDLTEDAPCKCIPCGLQVCSSCSMVLYDRDLKRKLRVCLTCVCDDPQRFRFKDEDQVILYWQTCPATWDSKFCKPYLLETEV